MFIVCMYVCVSVAVAVAVTVCLDIPFFIKGKCFTVWLFKERLLPTAIGYVQSKPVHIHLRVELKC